MTTIIEYLFEAIYNNKKGNKVTESKGKTVEIAVDVKKIFKTAKVLPYFKFLTYTYRKKYVM